MRIWHQSTVICPSLLGRRWSSRKGRISATGRGRRRQPNTNSAASNAAATAAASDAIIGATTSGVLTRNRNKNENDNSRDGFDGSNRSTPQPGIKQEPKDEKDDE